MARYDVWEPDGSWWGEYPTIHAALGAAVGRRGRLVTERTPLGDPRIAMVEDAASAWYRNRPTTKREHKWVSEANKRIEEAERGLERIDHTTRRTGRCGDCSR